MFITKQEGKIAISLSLEEYENAHLYISKKKSLKRYRYFLTQFPIVFKGKLRMGFGLSDDFSTVIRGLNSGPLNYYYYYYNYYYSNALQIWRL